MWTVVVSGKKKLRVRKYPDTCGRGGLSKSFMKILEQLSHEWLTHRVTKLRIFSPSANNNYTSNGNNSSDSNTNGNGNNVNR